MSNYNTKQLSPLYSESGKIIGWKEPDAICKSIIASLHMLQKPKGIAWDLSVLERAREEGLKKTRIYDKETGNVYEANIEDFFHFGFEFNRGYGKQVVLPIERWRIKTPGKTYPIQLALPL